MGGGNSNIILYVNVTQKMHDKDFFFWVLSIWMTFRELNGPFSRHVFVFLQNCRISRVQMISYLFSFWISYLLSFRRNSHLQGVKLLVTSASSHCPCPYITYTQCGSLCDIANMDHKSWQTQGQLYSNQLKCTNDHREFKYRWERNQGFEIWKLCALEKM